MIFRLRQMLTMWLGALGCTVAMAQPAGVQPLVQPEPGVEVSRIDIAEPLQRESHDAAPPATLSPFFDTAGMVLHANTAQLPQDCTAISGEAAYTVHAGTRHALPGTQEVFAYDIRTLVVPPCSRVTVTLVNDDATRHQWLLHGLPFALYPGGLFMLEANGGQRVTGTFIVPGAAARYPVQSTNAQNSSLGMQAELVVEAPVPGFPRGSLVLILAMALTSGSLLLTMRKRSE